MKSEVILFQPSAFILVKAQKSNGYLYFEFCGKLRAGVPPVEEAVRWAGSPTCSNCRQTLQDEF